MSGDAAFSRSSGVGKCDAEAKFRLPSDALDDLQREARKVGMGVSEFLRDLTLCRLYGVDYMVRMHAERLRVVAGNGPTSGDDLGTRAGA